ncbi:MAG: hypothetical protein ABIR47_07440 [Candidatus Kapaibacterium sp.]
MMTEAEYKILDEYMRTIADRLMLRDWTIIVKRDACGENSAGDMWGLKGRKVAYIRVADDFRTTSEAEQRHTVVHELLHCHFESAWHVIEHDLKSTGALGGPLHMMCYESFKRQMEFGVDGVADALDPYMPPIVWEVPTDG